MVYVGGALQTPRDGRCQDAGARRKGHRRQRTRPVSAAAAAVAATATDKETEVRLLHHHSELYVSELDTSLGSPYRRRPAATAGRPTVTQVVLVCSDADAANELNRPNGNKNRKKTSGRKFTILWGHVDEILLLNKFFSDCRYM